jgi:hypothetical protein
MSFSCGAVTIIYTLLVFFCAFGAGFFDAGFFNAGFFDTGFFDTGFFNTGFFEVGFFDTGFFEVGFDTGFFDTGFFDTGFFEVGFDTGFFEVGFDTGFFDAGFFDAGFFDTGFFDLASCESPSPNRVRFFFEIDPRDLVVTLVTVLRLGKNRLTAPRSRSCTGTRCSSVSDVSVSVMVYSSGLPLYAARFGL